MYCLPQGRGARTKGSYIGICVWFVKDCSLLPTTSFSSGLCGVIQLKSHLCPRFPHLWRMPCHSTGVYLYFREIWASWKAGCQQKLFWDNFWEEIGEEQRKRHTQSNLEMLQDSIRAGSGCKQSRQLHKRETKAWEHFPWCPSSCMAADLDW